MMKKDEKQYEKKEGEKGKYGQLTNDEIKQLAEDMYKGLIFTDKHLRAKEELSMVFLPFVFMGKEFIDELNENPPGMIYEYMDKAGPMAVNGMPIFLSLKMTSIDDTKKIFEHYHKIKEAITNI